MEKVSSMKWVGMAINHIQILYSIFTKYCVQWYTQVYGQGISLW
jgi:hypothetical protein